MNAQALLDAIRYQEVVSGLTHNFYRYPARFSPMFARGTIEAFSHPGDVIFDPFMGGATTLVEARALGRHAVGADISTLSVFLSRVKTTPLSENDIIKVIDWFWELPEYLNLHLPPIRATEWQQAGYQRHVPWPIRKSIELALARIGELPRERQQGFARCILLRLGQWALDCRERIPSAEEFRFELIDCLDTFTKGMREFRDAVKENPAPGRSSSITLSVHCPAVELTNHVAEIESLPKRPNLVVTSPPYPGVYVLYHRWKVRGRKESPAPFWVADCQDGQGQAHYCFGHRKQQGLTTYFNGIRDSFLGVRQVIDPRALVVQMVAFSEPDWQIPRYLKSMQDAGFEEVMPKSLGIPVDERLWRKVPGRRWFALIQASLATSKEMVLFHRPKPP
jgi:DNA methylase